MAPGTNGALGMSIDSQLPMIDGEQIDFNKKCPSFEGPICLVSLWL
jgi:hypothetical protein